MTIDANVNLSRWPFRRTPCDEPEKLVATLRRGGVTQAWTGTLDGLFHRDVAAANARLAADCRRFGPGLLVPFGTINPKLPDWRDDLRRCREEHHMPGVRLHPNFHGYKLDDPLVAELLTAAEQAKFVVQIALKMDDVRVQHPLIQVPDVDPTPLAKLLATRPKLSVTLLNTNRTIQQAAGKKLVTLPNVYIECAMWETIGAIEAILAAAPDRALFGSHLPLFSLESSLLKLRESVLTPAQERAIRCENAQRLLAGRG